MNELLRGIEIEGNRPADRSEWRSVANVPGDLDLELAVIDAEGEHVLVFPCRRGFPGWVKAATGERVHVQPTHWREWKHAVISTPVWPDA